MPFYTVAVDGSLGLGNGVSVPGFEILHLTGSFRMRSILTLKWASLVKEVRTMTVMGDFLLVVIGDSVYRIDKNLVTIKLGIIGTQLGAAWIKGDINHICVVDGFRAYTSEGYSGDLLEVGLPDNFQPSSLAFQDGYFIISREDSARFYISALLDPTSWDPLDFATAEGDTDDLVCVYSHNRDLWLFGDRSTEIWYNSGATAFPFERYQGGFIQIGCKAARSIASSETQVFWLDNELRVRMGVGVQSQVVSTAQIDYQIAQLSDWEEAVGFYYMQEGHGFYQLTIANKTLVYDASTGFWHSRAEGLSNDRHPAQCHALFDNKNLVGHYRYGIIYYFDMDTYTNDGEPIIAIRAAQTVHSDRKRVFHGIFEIEFEAGVGNDDAPNPEAILEWSDDDGHTWSSQHSALIGAAAAYRTRAIWRRLGQARGRVYKVTIDDPVKRVIIGAHLEGGPGSS